MLDQLLLRSRFVPSDPPRRRGATSASAEQGLFGMLGQLLGAVPWGKIGLGASVLLVTALIPWGTGELLAAMDRQFMRVEVAGTLVGENRNSLERNASQWLGKSFFTTDLADIKTSLEARPWVDSAAVRREWPDRLVVEIREHRPLAYWNDGQVISRTGEVFQPSNPEAAGALPRLRGPEGRVREVIDKGRLMANALEERGMGFAGIALEERGAWTLTLTNGIEVALGRDQVEERFERFLTVYGEQLASRADQVERIDVRYTNGVAVRWKPLGKASGNNS
ncbi:cell division protein FtsQ [Marinobacter daqiaonensis]|uniref:Cell division protein FtsQ n=1 Tax=Marinobacter daqiaonensis TaxID=650891 RepID=A0A1I6J323_9GAMM|nr:cell division protein FtsQ/DivIB [Marinobacter daqiaonensis]SFR73415.1 cell division protein FtsQ [Marinobacter daqiaonensis]